MTRQATRSQRASRADVYRPTGVGRPGDWLEVRGLPGFPTRRGLIEEVLGREGHERYRVRWDEQHESIVFPAADGVHVIPKRRGRR